MKTIIEFFEESVQKFPENSYLWEKRNGDYTYMTYSQVKEKVYQFAAGLISLGIKKGDRMALIAEGRNDWVGSELGILYTGAINVPLSVKLTGPEELKFRLRHSDSRMVITSKGQLHKIRKISDQLPALEKIILLDEEENRNNNEILFSREEFNKI